MNPALTRVKAILLSVSMLSLGVAGCAEQNLQGLTGAPDGKAEILVASGENTSDVEHQEGTFRDLVDQPNRVVLVEFWGPHCGPCHHLAPVLEQIAKKYPEEVAVVKVDVESSANYELAMFFGIHAIPEMRIFVDGQPQDAIHGYVHGSRISDTLDPIIAQAGTSEL